MDAANGNQEWLRRRDNFRRNAFVLIIDILRLTTSVSGQLVNELRELVKEALHSIFFMAKIMNLSLNEIFAKNEFLLEGLSRNYEEPFQLYSTHVPQRHPMSCVLDMIVRVSGERNENDIKERLKEIRNHLERDDIYKFLISTTMCVSQKSPDSVRYYGVSMSTSGGRLRDIMIAASCCVYWDSHVADAVMTYYLTNNNDDFDGTIRLPSVRCQAFNIRSGEEKAPCESCRNLFGLETAEAEGFPYGNCAEVESVSKLVINEPEIINQAELRSRNYPDNIREMVRGRTLEKLEQLLPCRFIWNNMFYPNIEYRVTHTVTRNI